MQRLCGKFNGTRTDKSKMIRLKGVKKAEIMFPL